MRHCGRTHHRLLRVSMAVAGIFLRRGFLKLRTKLLNFRLQRRQLLIERLLFERDEPPGRGPRGRGASGHCQPAAGAQALSPRQPALPHHGTGARGAGDAADARAGAVELEARRLPRAAAARPVGPRISVPEPRPPRRDRRVQLRRRRRGGRRRLRRGHRLVEPVRSFHWRRGRGFTLIEVLVVLAIMAVVAAAVVAVGIPGDAEAARAETRRLASLLESAMRESRASGRSIAWSPVPQGYAFWQRGEDGDWVLYPRTSLYRSRALSGRAELTPVRVDGRGPAPGRGGG